jgi:hypothetical protein
VFQKLHCQLQSCTKYFQNKAGLGQVLNLLHHRKFTAGGSSAKGLYGENSKSKPDHQKLEG